MRIVTTERRSAIVLTAVALAVAVTLSALHAQDASPSPGEAVGEVAPSDGASPADSSPADGTVPADPTAPADGSAPADGAAPYGTMPADGTTLPDGTLAPDGTMPPDGTAPDGTAPDTSAPDAASPSEPPPDPASESATPPTTVTSDVVRPTPGEFSAAPDEPDGGGRGGASGASVGPGRSPGSTGIRSPASGEPTTGTRGQAATFRLGFAPTAGVTRKLTESNSEQMKLILPPSIDEGPPEERSRLTTTSIVSTITFDPVPEGGWKQAEVVQQYRRYEEGIAMPDPLEPVLRGARLVTRLDANGAFTGVDDPGGFLAGLLARAPEPDRPLIAAALSPEAIDHESRQGWQRKIGRYLSISLRIGHPSFLIEYGEVGEVGRLPYILCAIPSTIEPVSGRQCVRVDLVSFAASLKDGVLQGVPDEVDSEFMAWAEGKDIPFSPPELSVWGAGEVLLELSGTGTVRYRNEESFHIAPARINRPMGGPVEADELTVKRIAELTLE